MEELIFFTVTVIVVREKPDTIELCDDICNLPSGDVIVWGCVVGVAVLVAEVVVVVVTCPPKTSPVSC